MNQRRQTLMQVQQPISLKKNHLEIGKVVNVLIEQENPETGELLGRSSRFSPEVDGLVYVSGEASLGSLVPVAIDDASEYDLYGHIATAADLFNHQPLAVP